MIGFVRGHEYLDEQFLLEVKKIMVDDENHSDVVKEYEEQFEKMIGDGRGTTFASARMAFFSFLKALKIGIGDEVILPGFTCSVMPNAILRIGARPVYVDINKENFAADPNLIKKKISSKTKLIVIQHSFGIPCDIEEIARLAKQKGIYVLEDCAITFDSRYEGIRVGNFADGAIFSTDHTKPLNTLVGGFFYSKNKTIFEEVKKIERASLFLKKSHRNEIFQRIIFERKYYCPKNYLKIPFVLFFE
ncbi:MAG: DegT/DnrJ/EryC1/StrS aminotransferase family protein [Oligoflexia bacterium]|nr:DegT/DnrJ/EryC1/StrS aminotransferase family protein [Oligoflexia bacterium]